MEDVRSDLKGVLQLLSLVEVECPEDEKLLMSVMTRVKKLLDWVTRND